MKAEDARRISFAHSERMQKLYKSIETSAKKGNNELWLNTSEATENEMCVLRDNGFSAKYEYSESDGGQFVVIKW